MNNLSKTSVSSGLYNFIDQIRNDRRNTVKHKVSTEEKEILKTLHDYKHGARCGDIYSFEAIDSYYMSLSNRKIVELKNLLNCYISGRPNIESEDGSDGASGNDFYVDSDQYKLILDLKELIKSCR